MTKPKRGRTQCEVCGTPLYSSNTMGICKGTLECRRERKRRQALVRTALPREERPTCKHPDGCPSLVQSHGLCGRHWRNLRDTGEVGPLESKREALLVAAGETFGRWTAIEDSRRGRRNSTLCRCSCERGTEKRVLTDLLKRGQTKSCGCLQREIASRPRSDGPYLAAGSVWTRLTLLEDAVRSRDMIWVRCECGRKTEKQAYLIKSGNTRSCGCMRREVNLIHGLSGHPLYHIWHGIVARCCNPNNANYERYGGDGRGLCERWQGLPDGLLNFAADMGPRPGPDYSTERINNKKGYEPGNCRWATTAEQNANRTSVLEVKRDMRALTVKLEAATRVAASGPVRTPGRVPVALDQGVLF